MAIEYAQLHIFEGVVREAQYQGIKKIASDLYLWH